MNSLERYLSCKLEDDLRIMENMPRSRCEIPMGVERKEIRAAEKAIAYLAWFRQDVWEREYQGILRAAGHRQTAIDLAMIERCGDAQ